MLQDTLNLEIKMNLDGSIEFLLPDQSKVTASRAEFDLYADANYQHLELTLEMPAEDWQKLQTYFELQAGSKINRFQLKPEALEQILPELQLTNQDDALLKAAQGAVLNFENYTLMGSSMWMDDAVSLFDT